MSINTPVVDRVPTYPGRVRLVPVSGQANTYDMARADQPVTEGTPINKALLDQKGYTLIKDVTLYVSPGGNDSTGNGTSGAPYKTINKALSTIPKNLGGFTATINIAAGNYAEVVAIEHFSSGNIVLTGAAAANVSMTKIFIEDAAVNLTNVYFTLAATGIGIEVKNGGVLTGITRIVINAAKKGVSVVDNALVSLGEITISNADVAVECGYCASFHSEMLYGASNAVGLAASQGGQISYGGGGLGASVLGQTATGGRIYTSAQTSIPNY